MTKHQCHPFGNAKAGALMLEDADPVPIHREPLYSNRPDLVAKYPTYADRKDFWRLPTLSGPCRTDITDKVDEKSRS